LGLDESYFDKDFAEPVATLRLLHYDKRQSEPEKGIYACGAHSDYGMATLLLTDEHPGLQIYHKGEWIDVPPRPHSFVVNLGDMLQIWTNGRYKSTLHRVLTSSEYERYSIPFFYDPHFETVVDCLPTCTSDNNPPKYTSTTAGQHLVSKYKETHADFAPEK
jgi:isopenicillin N synthase-like dioxygenase